MYPTQEERLAALEKIVEKQAFQIDLLQSLVSKYSDNKLYPLVISANMSKQCFERLQQMTSQFEHKIEQGFHVTLHEFIYAFDNTLKQDGVQLNCAHIAELIPKWLGGSYGSLGFSQLLHKYFYE